MRRTSTGLSLLLSVLVSWQAWALNAGLGAPPPRVDRQTPYATANGFSDAVHQGDYVLASHYLYLDFLPASAQKETGAKLARQLKFVLDHKLLPTALASLSKEPEGDPDSARFDQVGEIAVGDNVYPIRLTRMSLPEGGKVWVFAEATVKAIEPLYERYGPVLLGEELPAVLFERSVLGLEPWQWLGVLLTGVLALVLCVVAERLTLWVLSRVVHWTRLGWAEALVSSGRGPLKLLYFSLLTALGSELVLLPPKAQSIARHIDTTLSIVAVAWFLLRFLRLSAQYVHESVAQDSVDAGRLRGLRTQLSVLRSVFEAATYVIAAALLLMQFETVRNVGVSLLASAGLAGIVIGLAAQKPVASLLAGIQISITQPIRIGDNVVIEGEFGTVEEITLTYVVVKVWDERRLVIPISQFLDKPFQNWSKVSPDILGTAEVYADFRTDVPGLRAELSRVLHDEGRALWDGKVQGLQVTALGERTMTLRALVSAADSGKAFDLRCLVREKLIEYLGRQPHGLPIVRAEGLLPTPAVDSRTAPALPAASERNVVVPGARRD